MKISLAKMVHYLQKMINPEFSHSNKLQIFQLETIQKIKLVKIMRICQIKKIFWADQNKKPKGYLF